LITRALRRDHVAHKLGQNFIASYRITSYGMRANAESHSWDAEPSHDTGAASPFGMDPLARIVARGTVTVDKADLSLVGIGLTKHQPCRR